MAGDSPKPKLAVWKFTSCDGCQLTLLDCEDQLLEIADTMEIANFQEASSRILEGPYDLSIIEGSVSTPLEILKIRKIREVSKKVIAIGACATAGGIQALRNFRNVREFLEMVYAKPEWIETLDRSSPMSEFVKVDFELEGCPPDRGQLLDVIAAFLNRRQPEAFSHSVCIQCKQRDNVCVLVAHGTPCLGPVTHAGCGAICPTYNRGCYGCFGPKETPNTASLNQWMIRAGQVKDADLRRVYRTFNAWKKDFSDAAEGKDEK